MYYTVIIVKKWISHKRLELLPGHDLTHTVWYKVDVDFPKKTEHFNSALYALICIDNTTIFTKVVCIDSKASKVIAWKFK